MAPRKAQDKGKDLRVKFESVKQKGRQEKAKAVRARHCLIGKEIERPRNRRVAEQLGVEKAKAVQERRALIGEKRRRKTDR